LKLFEVQCSTPNGGLFITYYYNKKKEGARPNNTLSYCMGLSNIAISELLGQNTTTDPFPHTSSLSIPVYIL
jgi:hypothetical protein